MDYPLVEKDLEKGVRFNDDVQVEVKSVGTDSGSESDSGKSFKIHSALLHTSNHRSTLSEQLPYPPPRSIKRVNSLLATPTTPTSPTVGQFPGREPFPSHLNSHPALRMAEEKPKYENPFKHEDDHRHSNLFPINDVESYKIHDLTFRQTMGVDARRPFFDFDELQRQILGHYQYKLFKADRGNKYGMTEDKWEASRALMKDYLDALQKYRWTQSLERMSQSSYSHYMSATEYNSPGYTTCVGDFVDIAASPKTIDPLRRVLFRVLPEFITIGHTSKHRRALHREWESAGLKKSPVVINSIVDAIARFIIALFGGAFLLAPIILINWITSEHMRLIIVSGFTVGFALVLALVKASNAKILGGAAAYAAIMVMYIGCLASDHGT